MPEERAGGPRLKQPVDGLAHVNAHVHQALYFLRHALQATGLDDPDGYQQPILTWEELQLLRTLQQAVVILEDIRAS